MLKTLAMITVKYLGMLGLVIIAFLVLCVVFACIRSAQISREERRIAKEQGLDRWR